MFAPVFVYPGAFHKSFFDPKDIKKEREEAKMRAIITVVGQDTVGILASVSRVCAEHNANVIEVTQSVLEELFVMVMLVNIDHLSGGINSLAQSMNALGKEKNLKIHVMHEDIFHSMHRI